MVSRIFRRIINYFLPFWFRIWFRPQNSLVLAVFLPRSSILEGCRRLLRLWLLDDVTTFPTRTFLVVHFVFWILHVVNLIFYRAVSPLLFQRKILSSLRSFAASLCVYANGLGLNYIRKEQKWINEKWLSPYLTTTSLIQYRIRVVFISARPRNIDLVILTFRLTCMKNSA